MNGIEGHKMNHISIIVKENEIWCESICIKEGGDTIYEVNQSDGWDGSGSNHTTRAGLVCMGWSQRFGQVSPNGLNIEFAWVGRMMLLTIYEVYKHIPRNHNQLWGLVPTCPMDYMIFPNQVFHLKFTKRRVLFLFFFLQSHNDVHLLCLKCSRVNVL